MGIKFISESNLEGKRVLLRLDLNVPLTGEESPQITDTTRIDLSLPTIKYILEAGASKIIIMGHLGRPEKKGPNHRRESYSLASVGSYLAAQLKCEVVLSESCLDRGIKSLLEFPQTKIVLLENLRFHPEETQNDRRFAQILASYGDIYINDAFGVVHRKHASVYAINSFFPGTRFGGFLLQKEIQTLEKIMKNPVPPFVGLMGGAKISDKIGAIERLLVEVDNLLIGGAMAYPFLKAKGIEVGTSTCSDRDVLLARNILALKIGKKIVLPVDHTVAKEPLGVPRQTDSIPTDMMGLDIGERTRQLFKKYITAAKTILWNGPMGYFENKNFAVGTETMAQTIGEHSDAFSVVGGGDSLAALKASGARDKISHVSTGGGAMLEFLQGEGMPGIQALMPNFE